MKIAGEYEVRSKATGKVVFIGKSDDIKHDWYLQRIKLLNRTNLNKELMQNFRKYGLSDFEMIIGRTKVKEEKKEIKPRKPRGRKK